jgi:hypothetical protein
MSMMTAVAEPGWVRRMREAGYEVRTGTGPHVLPENPEVDFSLPCTVRIGLRRSVKALARKLWQRDPPLRVPGQEGHAALP